MPFDAHEHEREHARPGPVAEPAAAPAQPGAELAQATGNRGFGAALDRMGAGLLPGGTVHPDVASAIGRAKGSGVSLPDDVRDRVAPHVGDGLRDVRLHVDDEAAGLARSVSARAFTTGTDVFFAAGEYQPSGTEGGELLAHELTHVAQQRGAPAATGPMTVSEPGQPHEVEAEAVARDVNG